IPFADSPNDARQGATVSSKDHIITQGGEVTAQVIQLSCNDPTKCGPCVGFCGGQSPAGCFCDAACVQFGDCCPGVQSVCGCSGASCGQCNGFCGGQSSAGCWCDGQCHGFGDCCFGKVAACGP